MRIETDDAGDPVRIQIGGVTFFREGHRVRAVRGVREGQTGRVIEPTGVHLSWVKWDGSAPSPYPHRSLERLVAGGDSAPAALKGG